MAWRAARTSLSYRANARGAVRIERERASARQDVIATRRDATRRKSTRLGSLRRPAGGSTAHRGPERVKNAEDRHIIRNSSMSLSTPTPRMRLKPGRRQVALGVALLLVLAHHVQGRAYMRSPAARNVVALGAYKAPWEIDAFDGGGPDLDQASGHGLCGGLLDDSTKTMLENGDWVSDVQTTYIAGGVLSAEIVVTEHRGGHLEMRLCELDEEANVTTQDCLNEHVLEYELTAVVTSYSDDMPYNLSSPADYSALPDELQCENIADRGPRGLCCRQGGKCSPESSNVDRWVLPEANTLGPNGASLYSIAFRLPANVTCAHCVLQMAIVDAPATAGEFPSASYNCADVAIEADEQESLSGLSAVASGAIAGSGGFLVLASFATLVWMRRRSYNEEDAESRFFGRSFTFTTGTNSVLTASLPRSLPYTESGRSAKLSLASRFRLSASSPRATAQVSTAGSSSPLPRGIMPEVEISNPAHGTTTAQATTAGSSSPLPRGLMPEVEIPPSVAPPSTPSVNIVNRPRTPSFRLPSFLQSRGPARPLPPPSPLVSSPPPGMNPPRRDNKAYRFSIDSDDV